MTKVRLHHTYQKTQGFALVPVIISIAIVVLVIALGVIGYVMVSNMNTNNANKSAVDQSTKSDSVSKSIEQQSESEPAKGRVPSEVVSSEYYGLTYGMPKSKVEALIGAPSGDCTTISGKTGANEQCPYDGGVKSIAYKDDILYSAEFKDGAILTKSGIAKP